MLGILAACLILQTPDEGDWPTYRADAQRSGTSAVTLDAGRLREAWIHRTTAPPRPAWPGPARWDAFAGLRGLKSMREYDPCPHVVAVGDRLWYGSTADDGVHCLDASRGERVWSFWTQGPVRVAPTWHEGRLYFGSDDGHAYCVDAESGSLIWKWSPAPHARPVLHDGNPISFWPVRTGVLVDQGLAYFGASMLPWKPSFLCAVDARTGAPPPRLEDPPFVPDAEGWQSLELPADWAPATAGALESYDGFAWYRCVVRVPPGAAPAVLEIDNVDDCDQAFFNGVEIGRSGGMPPDEYQSAYQQARRYEIPSEHVREGWNVVAIRVYDGAGGGGIVGDVRLSRGPVSLPLSGRWQFRLGDDPSFADPSEAVAGAREAGAFFPQAAPALGPFQRRCEQQTMEGPLLLADRQIVVPQGRVAPLLYRRGDGRSEGSLQGGGGVFVLLTDDHHVIHGPGNKTGWMTESSGRDRAKLASFDRGHALVVSGHWAFLLGESSLSAIDRSERKIVWQQPADDPFDIVLAGEHLFLGGEDRVSAHEARTGRKVWSMPVRGRAHGLSVARGALYVSTDEGFVHCFRVDADAADLAEGTARETELPTSPAVRRAAGRRHQLGRWVFHRSTMRDVDGEVPTSARIGALEVQDLAGSQPAQLVGPATVQRHGELECVVLDGSSSIPVAADFRAAPHPTESFSAEAWVRVDAPAEWGGLIGMCQDNGDFERGWLLGYRQSRFAFTLTGSASEDQRATCLRAHADFARGRWSHVVATYDGRTMRLYVDGKFSAESEAERGPILYPPAAPYEIAAYKDDNEYFPMQGALHEVLVESRVLDEREIRARFEKKRAQFPEPAQVARTDHQVRGGPWLRFLGEGRAEVEWETEDRVPTVLRWGLDAQSTTHEDPTPRRFHLAPIEGLRPRRVYHYQVGDRVDGEDVFTESYECDTFFDWTESPGAVLAAAATSEDPPGSAGWPGHRVLPLASSLLKLMPERGLVLIVDDSAADRPADEDWALLLDDLARASSLRLVFVTRDERRADALRAHLGLGGLHGHRLRVRLVEDPAAELPLGVFDLVLDLDRADPPALSPRAALALTRPRGHLLTRSSEPVDDAGPSGPIARPAPEFLAQATEWLADSTPELYAHQRLDDPGAGNWTHLYAEPGNSAYGGEELGGAAGVDELDVQWLGRPGPRYQSDRQNRKPSPLCAGGRLYLQGLYRILALRAHNGTILWSLELPRMARFNVTRDCANWCADEDFLYVAIEGRCWKIDGESGRVEERIEVPTGAQGEVEWGYIARSDAQLLGTSRPRGTAFTAWWGGDHWYDKKEGAAAAKAASDALFALDAETGRRAWQYSAGAILESTITLAEDRIYFVETRQAEVLAQAGRRLHDPRLWQDLHLVCLGRDRGDLVWQRPITPPAGDTAFYLVAAEGKLVLSSSAAGSFHVLQFDAGNGDLGWEQSFPWEADHHGKHLSHPAVANGRIYLRPQVLDLASGQPVPGQFPAGHTCSSYTLSSQSLFLRAGSITMWTPESDQVSRWPRMRPDCWISTIPAAGLLLSPEGGGGCSCGSWMETSIAFRPRTAAAIPSTAENRP